MDSVGGWDLYKKEGTAKVVAELNTYFDELIIKAKFSISSGEEPQLVAEQTRDSMYAFMDTFENYGTRDTEPESHLVSRICSELHIQQGSLLR